MPIPNHLCVLVVEDEALLRWSLSEILRREGHKVIEATNAAAARAAIDSPTDDIDVVLLDYRLPDSSDFTLLDDVRRRRPQCGVVVMTAFSTPELTEKAVARGAYRVVSKPFDMHEVDDLVRNAYDAAQHR